MIKLIIFAAIVYLIWALYHHRKDKSLTLPIFLEYVLTAVLVLILIAGVKI